MKRKSLITLVALALVTLLITAYSRTPQTEAVKKVSVTAKTIASQPAGKPLVLDLTKRGTVYEIDANVNYSQVRIRAAIGERQLSRKAGATGKFLVGHGDDLSAINFGFSGGGTLPPLDPKPTEAKCDKNTCYCVGPKDCKDLNKAKWCWAELWACGKGDGNNNTTNQWGCFCVANSNAPTQ